MRTKADRTVKFRRPLITDEDEGPYLCDDWITGVFRDKGGEEQSGLCARGVSRTMNIPDDAKTMWITLSVREPRHADAVEIVMEEARISSVSFPGDTVRVRIDKEHEMLYGKPARILSRFLPHEGDSAWATFYHDGSPDKKRRTR